METFKEVLTRLINKYPMMEPQDVIKLTYQNEYGPGHLFNDKEMPLLFLKEEYYNAYHDSNEELFEDIGNGLLRVNLHAFDGDLEILNDCFIESCKHQGNHISFEYKIQIILELAKDNIFNFSFEEMEDYLYKYERSDYPIVSHSQKYKELYKPSYRVVEKVYEEKIKNS